MMNQYGVRVREQWTRHAPTRLAALEDPEGFFTDLGAQIAAEVSDLTNRLENSPALTLETRPSSGQTYLQEISRRMTAHRIAEEVVMNQHLAWLGDPSLPLDQAREEWEQTRPADESLVAWAERAQDSLYPMYSTAEIENKAIEWAVPTEFLTRLLEAEIPGAYMEANREVLAEAATIRFLREVH